MLELKRVADADASGANGCSEPACLAYAAGSVAAATVSGANAYVTYEVTKASGSMDFVELPVYLCKGSANDTGCHVLAGTIAMKDMQVKVSIAPVVTQDTVQPESIRPRFIESPIPAIDLLRWPH